MENAICYTKKVSKTPSVIPKGSAKRLLTPHASHKKGQKKMKSIVSPSKLITEVEDTNIIFDEMEEEITKEAKCFIDIASDSQVIEEISKAVYLHYYIEIFRLANIVFCTRLSLVISSSTK